MVDNDNLNLRTIRLKAAEQWKSHGVGFLFVLANAGVGNYVSGPFTRHLLPGDVLVVKISDNYSIHVPAGVEFDFSFFSISLEPLYTLFSSQESCHLQHFADTLKTARYYSAAENVAKEAQRLLMGIPPQFNFQHRTQLLRVAASVISFELEQAQFRHKAGMRIDNQVGQLFEKLTMTEIMNLSAGEMAVKFNCSRRHLNRLFHQQFGFSVTSLRMEMRLLKAASLLHVPNAKVANVAEECGFNHLGMFNSLFKKRFGANPSRWREGAQKLETVAAQPRDMHPSCPLLIQGLCPRADKTERVQSLTLIRSAA